MRYELPYEYVQEHYPEALEQVLEVKANSASKNKDTPPEECVWYYDHALRAEATSLTDMLQGNQQPKPDTAEGRVQDWLDRTNGSIAAQSGRGYWRSDPVDEPPEMLVEEMHEQFEKELEEEARVAGLTDEERNAEVSNILGQLQDTPGFKAFGIQQEDGK